MLGQASDVMKSVLRKDFGFLLVCARVSQAQRPLLLGPCRAAEINQLQCMVLLSRGAALSSRSVN